MTNKKADVKDGKAPARAKPLRTQFKAQEDPKPARGTSTHPTLQERPAIRHARPAGEMQRRRVVSRYSKGVPKPLIEFKIDAQPPKTNMRRFVKIVRLKDLPASERRVQVAAARLRVTLDGRLDRSTPPEVRALAKEPL